VRTGPLCRIRGQVSRKTDRIRHHRLQRASSPVRRPGSSVAVFLWGRKAEDCAAASDWRTPTAAAGCVQEHQGLQLPRSYCHGALAAESQGSVRPPVF
jgi:hypothetical protein